MNLHKYVSANVLVKIIEKQIIRFTQTCCLNDPYKGHMYDDNIQSIEIKQVPEFKKQIEFGEILAPQIYEAQINSLNSPLSRLTFGLAKSKEAIENKYGVLSLSRNPYSLLMWAHYAKNHKGCVIEIDAKKLLNKENFNEVLFDIYDGVVIYSSIKNDNFIKPKLESSQITLKIKHNQKGDLSCLIQ